MSQPQAYDRQYNFINYQMLNPADPLPAAQVEAEYNAVKITLDQMLSNLALIQRDDGKLRNGSVGSDQLAPSLSLGFTLRGAWASPINYTANDGVTYNAVFYRAKSSHLSDFSQPPDLRPDLWELLVDFNNFAPVVIGDGAVTQAKISGATTAGFALLTAADAPAQRYALGQEWVRVFDQTLSAAAAAIVIPLTGGFRWYRFRIGVVPAVGSFQIALRVCTDGTGTNFVSGVSSYVYSGSIEGNGATAHIGTTLTSFAAVSSTIDPATFFPGADIDISVQQGSASRAVIGRSGCAANAAGDLYVGSFAFTTRANAAATHIRLGATIGGNTFDVGTRVMVEGC